MTTIRRIVVSQLDGDSADNTNTSEIRPFGETAFYLDTIGESNKLTLMMFDGVRTHRKSKVLAQGVLWGSNADAGDGSSADTIKLIPDAELFAAGSNQYLVVDPTAGEPGHIHLRAGGTQDSSTADLYLGGEQTFVRVSDTYDNVTIRTSGASSNSWIFSVDGSLTFPGGLTASPLGNFIPVAGTAIQQNENEILQVVSKGLSGGMTIGWAENPFEPSHVAALAFNANSEGEVRIATGSYTGTVHTWAFGTTGTITFPSGGSIVFDSSATSTITGVSEVIFADGTTQTTAWLSGTVSSVQTYSVNTFIPETGTFTNTNQLIVSHQAHAADYGFTFTIDYQSPLDETKGVTVGAINTPLILSTSSIKVRANLSTSTEWSFGTDGSLTFPDGTAQSTAYEFVSPPVSSTSTGVTGALAHDATYFYVCTATNSWKRIAWDTNSW